jgi:ribosome-binding protein aMBF1 (putative translation factor)
MTGSRANGSHLVNGRQLRAARVLAGLTQAQLAAEILHRERAVRLWESEDRPPSLEHTRARLEQALERHGVIVFSDNSRRSSCRLAAKT